MILSTLQHTPKIYIWRHLVRLCFLAHRIRISEILAWDRKPYLTQAILPRLSREGYIYWLYWNSSTWSSSDVIVMLKWRHHVKLHLSILRDFWKKWWARKWIHYLCEGKIEKSVPQDHRSSSLSKPRDAKQRSSGQIFLSYPHTHDRFLYSRVVLYLQCSKIQWLFRDFWKTTQQFSRTTSKWYTLKN